MQDWTFENKAILRQSEAKRTQKKGAVPKRRGNGGRAKTNTEKRNEGGETEKQISGLLTYLRNEKKRRKSSGRGFGTRSFHGRGLSVRNREKKGGLNRGLLKDPKPQSAKQEKRREQRLRGGKIVPARNSNCALPGNGKKRPKRYGRRVERTSGS